ncbi:MAG: 5,10-methylenetetrahydrofolate reductase [Acidimicrobiales bacterium]|nr:5,10-methylenetetrahydrofolate reductase [Acidimicrobiales bacterium]
MTKIHELLAAGPTHSFEFGPPRDAAGEERLEKTLLELEPLQPSFVSVTYGAGGSTRDMTRQIVEHIARDTSMTPMPHLTCVAHTRAQLEDIVTGYRDFGMENILALGGDAPADGASYPSDFLYATELLEVVKELGDFSIGVAAFPEGHPRSPDLPTDRRHLAEKLRVADFGITQFFFRAEDYFRMVEELAALGVDTPVLPGIMAFTQVDGLRRMAGLNATTIPDELQARLDEVNGDPRRVRELAVEVCTPLIAELLEGGAPGVHLYTLNFPTAPKQIWANLGLGPKP